MQTIFYDGSCGLCHRYVRLILWLDREAGRFRFAPLGGDTFQAEIAPERRQALPDSIVVKTARGVLLCRSEAVLYVLEQVGGGWRCLGRALSLLPAALLDRGYDFVARVRYRLFARPQEVCPMVSAELRNRFLP